MVRRLITIALTLSLTLTLVACDTDSGTQRTTRSCQSDGDCGAGLCFDSKCYQTCERQDDCAGDSVCVSRQVSAGEDAQICTVAADFLGCEDATGCAAVVVGPCEEAACGPDSHLCGVTSLEDGIPCDLDGAQGVCAGGACHVGVDCAPDCGEHICGDDGCGGSCGQCGEGTACEDGACVACTPECGEMACGDDGCGGSCGQCEPPFTCVDGACVESVEPTTGCLQVYPQELDFGATVVGTKEVLSIELSNCGDVDVSIQSVALVDVEAPFGIAGSFELPSVVSPSEVIFVEISYSPTLESESLDQTTLQITSSASAELISVPVSGLGVTTAAPTAVIEVQEGEEVIPQTQLHLIGSQSYSDTGVVTTYAWSVEQPAGSMSVFLPSASYPDPTFEVNVAGVYTFRLTVTDSSGASSVIESNYTVQVIPDEAIHVELLWSTPGDPDETDQGPEAGADLDLHFTHPSAATEPDLDGDGEPDPWFNQPFDCFWFNPSPDWGATADDADDPGLDRDDTDGAGPENVNLNVPEDGVTYTIGAHYWGDHGYGPSLATVRVYVHGVLVFQTEEVSLSSKDMWWTATIDWPSGQVTPITGPDGGYRITPEYNHAMFAGT